MRVAHQEVVGRFVSAEVVVLGLHGARLRPEGSLDEDPTVLLPQSEVPEGVELGQSIDVFVHLDSEDRLVATLRTPKLSLGEVAFLEVTDRAAFGVFCDWGLVKDLLVPGAEQTRDVAIGDRHPIGLYVDDSGRLAGTMRVSEMLRDPPPYAPNDWVQGEAWRKDPDLGVFVILDRRHVALLPASEPHTLGRGQPARFRVTRVHPDGRAEVSLRDVAHKEADHDASHILAVLRASRDLRVGDRSPPEQISQLFGLSKKAFKRAVGGLLKRGQVTVDARGFLVLVEPATDSPRR